MGTDSKIAIVGGSNSVMSGSYAWQLVEHHGAENFSIGATYSMHGLMNIIKDDKPKKLINILCSIKNLDLKFSIKDKKRINKYKPM